MGEGFPLKGTGPGSSPKEILLSSPHPKVEFIHLQLSPERKKAGKKTARVGREYARSL